MSLKATPTQLVSYKQIDGYETTNTDERKQYITRSPVGDLKHALDVSPKSVYEATTDIAEAGSEVRKIVATAHSAQVGDIIRFTSGALSGLERSVVFTDTNNIIVDGEYPSAPVATTTFSILRGVTQLVNSDGTQIISISSTFETIIDQLDIPFYEPSTTGDGIIPKSSSNATQIVASLADTARRIQVISDIGEFMALYSDAARTTLICHLPLASGEVEVTIGSGTTIYIGALNDVDIDDSASRLIIQFIG